MFESFQYCTKKCEFNHSDYIVCKSWEACYWDEFNHLSTALKNCKKRRKSNALKNSLMRLGGGGGVTTYKEELLYACHNNMWSASSSFQNLALSTFFSSKYLKCLLGKILWQIWFNEWQLLKIKNTPVGSCSKTVEDRFGL